MEIIDEETGFNDKIYEMQLKKIETLKNTWKIRYFNDISSRKRIVYKK